MRRLWQLTLVCLFLWGTTFSIAQSTNSGDIRGSVTDTTGAVIPGATVTVLNTDTGVAKDFVTNQDGLYDTSSIVAGTYKVTFARDGFAGLVRGPLTLQVGLTTINAQLKVGSASEQVVVNSDVALLKTESGDQTVTMEAKSLAQLPQVTQSWENFMILLPGTAGISGNNANQGSNNPGQGVAANGNLPYSNVLADGASTTLSHSQNANPAIFETISELQVSLSAFSAQYGIGGMIINQISKGGASSYHGSAYDYLQNNYLNAAQYGFGHHVPVPFSRYNNFGASIGGPILKKKMFFFFDYDQIVNHGAAGNSTQTVPTQAVLNGDFTGQRTLYDPTTQTIAYDSQGAAYPVRKSFLEEYGTNAIPQGMIDAVSAKFQQFYPTTSNHIASGRFVNGTTNSVGLYQNNWFSSVPQSTPYRKYFGRLDYDITSNNRLTMSDTQSDTPVQYPSNVTSCPVNCQSGDVDNNNAQISDVWNLSSRTINEARMGYTWQGNFFTDRTLGKGYPGKLGWQFAKGNTIPAIQFTNTYPYAWIQPQSNSVYKEHVFDPSDVVTMIRGKHVLHFGGEMLIYQDNSTPWGNTNAGTMQFSGQYTQHWTVNAATGKASAETSKTGVEYADFLLGLANSWNAQVTPEYGARLKSPQVFIQDDYKVRSNLTVNLGLRYQVNHGWNETHGNIDSFDPTLTNPKTGTPGATWYASTHLNGRKSLQADVYTTFLPRVGFAWQPQTSTTLRGGFGIYSYNWSLDNYGSGMGAAFGSSGGTSDQTNGVTPVVKLGSSGASLPFSSASTNPARFNGQPVGYNMYHTPVPKIYQWNLALQRQLSTNFVAEIAYVASHGFNLTFPTDLNQVPKDKLSGTDQQYRPYQQYQNITGNTYNAISNYNSLQASITKRLTSGLSFSFNYVWSHFLDDQDSAGWGNHQGPQLYQIANDPSANYSNSNFDVRNAFKGQVVYQLPFGRGQTYLNNNRMLDVVIGGWQLSSTIVLQSGQPFTVVADGNTYAQAGSQFPTWSGLSATPQHRSKNEWYNPQAFSKPADGTFGNVRRNSLYGPGLSQVNLSGGKTFAIWEQVRLQIRVDAANALNHPNFQNPTGTLASPDDASGRYQGPITAQITNTTVGGRNVQLGARLSF